MRDIALLKAQTEALSLWGGEDHLPARALRLKAFRNS